MCTLCGIGLPDFHGQTFTPLSGSESGDGLTASTASVSDPGEVWKGVLHDTKWAVSSLQFSFPTSASFYASTYGSEQPDLGFEALNSVQKDAVRSLYNEIESFTDLTFTEVTESSTTHAELRFAMTLNNTPTAAGYFPYGSDEAGDSWYRNDGNYDDPRLGSYAYNEGFMHEIGHTLGLTHGHDSGNPFGALPSNVDSNEFSVMTYRDHVGDSFTDPSENEIGGNAQSYMMYDIAALQYMYGADYSASGNVWSGDTVYTFDPSSGQMSINGAGQGTPVENRIFRTIWDGNGVDTYDLSNYTTDLSINLNPGEWSIFSQAQLADLNGGSRSDYLARGNVANALLFEGDLRSLIENANGGRGNDTIIGNQGSNELRGNGGNDNLQGGDGRDKAIYSGAYSEYSITENIDGSFTIAHTGGDRSDGTDTVRDIEYAVFSDREVALAPLTGPLDVVFLQDLTASFIDDLPSMRAAVDDIAAVIQNAYANSRFAVTSFRDTGDSYVYRVEADFTQSTSSLVSTYNSMNATGGGDTPEAQLTALLQASTDSSLSYQSGSTRIFILATDAGYHNYESTASIAALMASNDIIPIFAVASGEVSTYQNLANELGTGVVVTIESDSADFADSIRYALASIDAEVTEAGTSSSDTLAGGDTADGIYGLGGDDTISGNGGDDLLDGGSGNDSLLGGDDNDQLLGGSGNDNLLGGEGNDRLVGGDGDDVLLGDGDSSSSLFPSSQSLNSLFTLGFDEDIQNSTTQTHATVQGTGSGTVNYYSFTVAAAGLSVVLDIDYADQNIGASDFDSWIVLYDSSGNQLSYSDDDYGGDPGSVDSHDSYLSNTLGSAGTYYVAVGSYSGLSPIPVGGTYELHVSVNGAIGEPPTVGAGNDVLNGGEGADSMAGGAGNDVYYVDNVGDTIEENADNGNDLVFSYISLALRDHSQNLEHLSLLGPGNINGTGNGLGNTITGNSGNNVLNGAYGNDVLRGGAGNDIFKDDVGADRMIGGSGNDVYYVDNVGDRVEESAGSGTDQVFSYISFALRDHSQYLEHLSLLGSGNTNGTGNAQHNTITGNSGNNILNGAGGNDILRGGAGNDIFKDNIGADRMIGGTGNDVYYVDNGGDRVEESAGSGTDQVFSYISFALRDHSQYLEHLSLLGSGDINGTGNGLGNTITGNAGNNVLNGAYGNDLLRGGAGNDIFKDDNGADRMIGGTGNDVYYVDNVGDRVEESAGSGTDQVFSYVSFTLRNHSQYLEHLSLLGSGNINGTGNGLNNIITGNSGNNVLNGAYGQDILRGGAGNDIFFDDSGNDIFTGGTGADTFIFQRSGEFDIITDFEDGIDTIRIATGSNTFSQVKISDDGADTIVQFDGSTVVLNNFNHALLGADDFSFV